MSRDAKVPLTPEQRQRLRSVHETVTTARATKRRADVQLAERAQELLREELGYLPGGLELPIVDGLTRKAALGHALAQIGEVLPSLSAQLARSPAGDSRLVTRRLLAIAGQLRLLEPSGFQLGPVVQPKGDETPAQRWDAAEAGLLTGLRRLYGAHREPTPEQVLTETLVACGEDRKRVTDNWLRALT